MYQRKVNTLYICVWVCVRGCVCVCVPRCVWVCGCGCVGVCVCREYRVYRYRAVLLVLPYRSSVVEEVAALVLHRFVLWLADAAIEHAAGAVRETCGRLITLPVDLQLLLQLVSTQCVGTGYM
jgi:hypothetical protein